MTPRRRKSSGKYLSTDQIDEATKLLVDHWKVGGRIALIGGAAMHFYGSDRFTKDVDFIANDTAPADDSNVLSPVSNLSFGGKRYMAPGQIPVDVIVREDHSAALYEEALDLAEPTEEGFLIVTPEYLAAMKFDAMRPKDELDLLWMLSEKRLVDVKKAEYIVRRHCGGPRAAREFRQMVSESAWRSKEGDFDKKDPDDDDGSEE
jgi:hypothetical protein